MEGRGMSSKDILYLLIKPAATAFVLLFLLYLKQRPKKAQPPGPRALPIIGHFHLLMKKDVPAHRILYPLSQVYGPIMHLNFGSRPVLVISSSQLAKECLSGANDISFASRPQLSAGKILGYDFSMLGWSPYGPYWRNVRKICTLELLSFRRIQMFAELRRAEIASCLRSLFEKWQSQQQGIINMKTVISDLILNVMMGMVINKRYFDTDASGIILAEAMHMIEESAILHGVFNVGDYIPYLNWLDLQGYNRAMKQLQNRIDPFIQRILEKHRENHGEKEEMLDFIHVLISQAESNSCILDKDAFVKSTALSMIIVGTDTSAVTIEWALSLLLQHPDILKKAQEELDTKIGRNRLVEESDIPQLEYLQLIVKETLRLYPAGPLLVPHESKEDCHIGGYHVSVGTLLVVNAWAIHRDPVTWKKPLEFKPERFMEGKLEMEIEGRGNNEFEMIPFGAGRRGCPGASLALCIVNIVLARLLQSFSWSLPLGKVIDMREAAGLTIPKAVPLEALIKPRLPPHLY
eukprot:Gb_24787 [translate_table: standard]